LKASALLMVARHDHEFRRQLDLLSPVARSWPDRPAVRPRRSARIQTQK
jgi:hypothetical protein